MLCDDNKLIEMSWIVDFKADCKIAQVSFRNALLRMTDQQNSRFKSRVCWPELCVVRQLTW